MITGGSGMIGSKLVDFFLKSKNEISFTYFSNVSTDVGELLDIRSEDATIQLINKKKPEIVFHTIAITNIDLCENNVGLAESVNVQGTKNIIEACKTTKSKIVFVSTSAVFGGKHSEYFEDDPHSPINVYGLTKSKAEKMIEKSGLSYLILRIDQPYCWIEPWQHINSVIRVINNLNSNHIMKEIVDWYNSPTYVPDFIKVTNMLIEKNAYGTYHLVGSSYLTRFDWSIKIAEVFRLQKELISPIKHMNLKLSAKRDCSKLNNDRIYNNYGVRMMGVDDGLRQMLLDKINT